MMITHGFGALYFRTNPFWRDDVNEQDNLWLWLWSSIGFMLGILMASKPVWDWLRWLNDEEICPTGDLQLLPLANIGFWTSNMRDAPNILRQIPIILVFIFIFTTPTQWTQHAQTFPRLHKFIHNELVRCASISHSGRPSQRVHLAGHLSAQNNRLGRIL